MNRRSVGRDIPRLITVGLLALTMIISACANKAGDTASGGASGSGDGDGAATLTIYSGQHEDLVTALVKAYRKLNVVSIEVRSGDDAELTNQLVEEGERTKADLILTEEPGPIAQLDSKGLLAPVDRATLDKVDQRFVPSTGDWLPWAARSRVMFYNPNLIDENDLPESILDLANPEWKGRFAYAPSGAFATTVGYLINTIGESKTLDWLKAIKENGVNEQKNGKVRDSVEAGQHEFGLANHYYWYVLAKEKGGAEALQSKVHYMGNRDAGALVLASGAGILKSSKNKAAAQKFLSWLAEADGGQHVVAQDTPQYPLVKGVKSAYDIKPLAELDPPELDQGSLTNTTEAKELMIRAGMV